ncbi:MAG: DEAD/DEAH box helicase [Verrucomicrobia bacterium]|nr:DEAD/DEAH box helicase [Verrucomicrobiota bacterium]MDA1005034.1 DEAD/DEAH box helicase [Verrucomicrobiota bacterium]
MPIPHSLSLTPGGHLRLQPSPEEGAGPEIQDQDWLDKVVGAFSDSQAQGLFAIAATKPRATLPPLFAFWRDFAGLYLTQLCRIPESETETEFPPIPPPAESELASLFLSAPPMRGGEYLGPATLLALWLDLDLWTRTSITGSKTGIGGWLTEHAPLWHQVGRVCFHLAENKRDPDYPFAFLATYAPSLSTTGTVQYQPLGKALQEYAGERNRSVLVKLLTPVQRAAESLAFVAELVETGDIFHPLSWTPQEAHQLLKNTAALEEAGLLVRLPNWWKKRPRPQVSVTIGNKKNKAFGVDTMLDFKVNLTLGQETLTKKEWQQLMESTAGLAFIKGQWVEIDQEKLGQVLDHWKQVEAEAKNGGISFIEGMRLLAGAPADLTTHAADHESAEWSFIKVGPWLQDMLTDMREPGGIATVKESKHFHGTLRPYQKTGRDWLHFLTSLGLGACLADDMGLGKTVQVLSLLISLKEQSKATNAPSLLVLPASLLANWKAEIAKFAPSLTTRFIHPSQTDKSTLATIAADPAKALHGIDLVLTTYGMLLRQKWLLEHDWQLAILDEAQAIKNPGARQTKAVKQLRTTSRLALTGTPVENRLSDLWSLFDFLSPGLLGTITKFKQFVNALEQREQDHYAPLRKLISPYVLRRLKTDKSIITDLPDKTEVKAYCGLSKKQAALYQASVEELKEALEVLDGIQRRGLVLSFLMRFKQICNHPSQLLGDGDYAIKDSGKLERLKSLCEEIAARQEKVLVFTQFREMTAPLADTLAGVFGRAGLTLHGGTSVKKRRGLVEEFQTDDGPPFFVLSLKAGGTGLTLTAASHVIHFDRWWNPAVENQATDRAFRIGQKRNVLVHKFICKGTLEDKIDALIEEKSGLAADLLEGGAQSLLTEMSNDELISAVTLDIDQTTL